MQKIPIKNLQKDINTIFNGVVDDQEPVSVSIAPDREVVLIDADEYNSIIETLYLLRSPANAQRLKEGIQQHQQGQRLQTELIFTENSR